MSIYLLRTNNKRGTCVTLFVQNKNYLVRCVAKEFFFYI